MKAKILMLGMLIICSFSSIMTNVNNNNLTSLKNPKENLTVGELIRAIQSQLTCDWAEETVDNLKTGSEDMEVTGIVTTFMATFDVIQKAKELGANFIITHEPTFYNHFDDQTVLENDAVQQTKLKFLEENNIAVWRFHDHWHRTRPDGIYKGVINAFDWNEFRRGDSYIFDIPASTVDELAAEIAKTFKTSTVRVVGDPQMTVNTVGMVLGAAGSMSQIRMLQQPDIQVVIVGESREWETVEYTRDAASMGLEKALIVMGHADSEEAGMEYCAEWLGGFVKDIPIHFVAAGNPLWSPE